MSSPAKTSLLSQVFRLARIGGVTFANAVWVSGLSTPTTSEKGLILAGAVAGIEAVYRQVMPASKATGIWSNLVTLADTYKQIAEDAKNKSASTVAPAPATPAAPATEPRVLAGGGTLLTPSAAPAADEGAVRTN